MSRFELTTDLATVNLAPAIRGEGLVELFPLDNADTRRRKRRTDETDELCDPSHFAARWWPVEPAGE